MRIAFAGTPDFAVPALEALLRTRHTVVGALTQPDRPKGRGRQLAASPVKAAALAHGIPVAQPHTLKDDAGRAELAAWRPDVLVVIAYGLILPKAALTLPRLGCINIHASLLPRWRGAAPIQRAILAGDTDTGVTIMLMDVGLDTGPMLLKREVSIAPTDTGGSLHDRLAAIGASAIVEALDGYAAGMLTPVPQPTEGVTYAAKIEKAEGLIDWNRPALEIERQVRAFNPWPIAETRLDGEQLRVFEATVDSSGAQMSAGQHASDANRRAIDVDSHTIVAESGLMVAESGTVVSIRDDALVIQCGSGRLALCQLQRPGRRIVSAGDFARGGGGSSGTHLLGKRLG